jgi:hypothetical protein
MKTAITCNWYTLYSDFIHVRPKVKKRVEASASGQVGSHKLQQGEATKLAFLKVV